MTLTKPKTVDEWLRYIEALHPKSIAMGLERVSMVAARLGLLPATTSPKPLIITVAGTNGKGSSCAMLTQIYVAAGYQVGTYTSPHLLRYHERVRINQQDISDTELCQAFAAVEQARREVELTYFEMGTLAAMWHFMQAKLEVVILEVGLGGRLDAVNIFDADCAIVTNVDLDHMEFLGDTREKIGAEKAGVYRAQQLAICGDHAPPHSLMAYAKQIGADLKCAQQDFKVVAQQDGWHYVDDFGELVLSDLSLVGDFQMHNAAAVLFAVRTLAKHLPVSTDVMVAALSKVQLSGRFQYLQRQPDIIVDVAHNPHAAASLLSNLAQLPKSGRVLAVFAMLADKDIARVVQTLRGQIDEWHIAEIQHARAASVAQLRSVLLANGVTSPICSDETVEEAFACCYKKAAKNDKIIVFGSFFTVAAILDYWPQLKAP